MNTLLSNLGHQGAQYMILSDAVSSFLYYYYMEVIYGFTVVVGAV